MFRVAPMRLVDSSSGLGKSNLRLLEPCSSVPAVWVCVSIMQQVQRCSRHSNQEPHTSVGTVYKMFAAPFSKKAWENCALPWLAPSVHRVARCKLHPWKWHSCSTAQVELLDITAPGSFLALFKRRRSTFARRLWTGSHWRKAVCRWQHPLGHCAEQGPVGKPPHW